MKVITIVRFKDKNTKCFHEIDDEFSVDQKRYKEIEKYVKIKEDPNNKNNQSSNAEGQISNN
jgi:hypothetical protein|nr:MAG TPA: hypothetical protein [Caudoviricetes sp.]